MVNKLSCEMNNLPIGRKREDEGKLMRICCLKSRKDARPVKTVFNHPSSTTCVRWRSDVLSCGQPRDYSINSRTSARLRVGGSLCNQSIIPPESKRHRSFDTDCCRLHSFLVLQIAAARDYWDRTGCIACSNITPLPPVQLLNDMNWDYLGTHLDLTCSSSMATENPCTQSHQNVP